MKHSELYRRAAKIVSEPRGTRYTPACAAISMEAMLSRVQPAEYVLMTVAFYRTFMPRRYPIPALWYGPLNAANALPRSLALLFMAHIADDDTP